MSEPASLLTYDFDEEAIGFGEPAKQPAPPVSAPRRLKVPKSRSIATMTPKA